MGRKTSVSPQEWASAAALGADHFCSSPASAPAGMVRFSLAGHDLVAVHDVSPAGEASEDVELRLDGRQSRLAGCLSVGGDTYTIFSLETQPAKSVGAARQRPIEFLTQRELQIAILVMQGKVNKQIAHRLHIAPNTVQSHLKRISCKLSVTSRAAMVAQLSGCLHITAPPG